ncbi:MAG: LysE family transporter [Campylobacteraceae bacterium]|nr:LysE family transporter [Campylobacteraceae bacterium]
MYEYFFILPIILALLLGSMSPGPSFLIVAQAAMAKSRSEAIAISIGMGAGAALFALLASIGLYMVIENVPWLYALLKIAGGIYLCYLAYKIWKSSKIQSDEIIENNNVNGVFKSFLLGFITQISNPKTAIVFAGVFAAFLPSEVPAYSYLILCILSFVVDAIWYIVVSLVLSTKKAQGTYTKHKKKITTLFSGFMGVMGLKLASNI